MTEKRFKECNDSLYCLYDDNKGLEYDEVIDLLNKYAEENEQLKSDNKEYIRGLELCKTTSQSWKSDVRELREQNCRLEKQNEKLKRKIERERNATTKQHLKWSDEAETKIKELSKENEELREQVKCLLEDLQSTNQINKEIVDDVREELLKENEQLKQVLWSILIGVRRDISATNHSGEVKAFVNPDSFDLISNVIKKYGALKDWYE